MNNKLDKELLFKGVIKTDKFDVKGPGVDRLWNLFTMYNGKRFSENYSKETFDRLIIENRFSYGAYTTSFNDTIVSFGGLSNFHNWAVITRAVLLNYARTPFTTGHTIPYLLNCVKNDNLNGLVATFNEGNRVFFETLKSDYRKRHYSENIKSIDDPHMLYENAAKTSSMFEFLEYPVKYYYTKQNIAYIPLKDIKPPFEEYNEN